MGKELSDSFFFSSFFVLRFITVSVLLQKAMPAEEARSRFECEMINCFNVKMRLINLRHRENGRQCESFTP